MKRSVIIIGRNYTYYINKYGERVPRVTSIIGLISKPQLIAWANQLGLQGKVYKEELDQAAEIGTILHAYIEGSTKNGLCILDLNQYKLTAKSLDQALNAIASFSLWQEEHTSDYKVINQEMTIVGDRYGGTIDCVIEDPKDQEKVVLVDYKTSSAFYLTHFIQLAAYSILYSEEIEDNVAGIRVLRCDKGGKIAQSREIRGDDLKALQDIFRKLASTYTAYKWGEANFWSMSDE